MGRMIYSTRIKVRQKNSPTKLKMKFKTSSQRSDQGTSKVQSMESIIPRKASYKKK